MKRKRLMARGWPTSSLLITVVRDEMGEGHAVLTVRTMQGDFILDNKVDEVHDDLDVARPTREQSHCADRRRAQRARALARICAQVCMLLPGPFFCPAR